MRRSYRADGRVALIVNADDFGQSRGINLGVMRAHTAGIVTSTSLMVDWPAAGEAAALARDHPELALGLHLDLGEWVHQGDDWCPLYQVVELDDPVDVEREMRRQLDAFRDLVGAPPTHLDSHQHVHLRDSVRPLAVRLARHAGIPLRGCTAGISPCGAFYGQTAEGRGRPEWIARERLAEILRSLPAGVHELVCHPGLPEEPAAAEPPLTMYREERLQEAEVLCDPRIRSTIRQLGIRLLSFADLRRETVGACPP